PVRDRLDEEDDPPDVVHAQPLAEILHRGSRPATQDAIVEVARASVAAAAGVVRVSEVGRRRREEAPPGPLAVALQPVAADAALEEDLLAAQEITLGHGQRVAGEPIAPIDLGEVRRLLELVLRRLEPLLVR